MKWKIAASPIRGQSSERQSNTATAIASGTLTTVTRLALEHNAESRAYPRPQEPWPTREILTLSGTNRIAQIGRQSSIMQFHDRRGYETRSVQPSAFFCVRSARFRVRAE